MEMGYSHEVAVKLNKYDMGCSHEVAVKLSKYNNKGKILYRLNLFERIFIYLHILQGLCCKLYQLNEHL